MSQYEYIAFLHLFFPFPLAYNSVVLKRAQRIGFKEINMIHILHRNEFYLTS